MSDRIRKALHLIAPELERLEADHGRHLDAIIASGVPVNAKHPLTATLDQARDDVKELRKDAAKAQAKLTAAEKAVADHTAEKGKAPEKDSDLFKTLDEVGREYDGYEQKIADAEHVAGQIIDSMKRQGMTVPTGADDPAAGDGMKELLAALRDGSIGGPRDFKSAGDRIVEGDDWKAAKAAGKLEARRVGDVKLGEGLSRAEVKALLTSGDPQAGPGAFVQADRVGYFPLPQRPITLLDLITVGDTDSNLVEYVRMVSMTNAAAEVAEAISAAPIDPRDGSTVTPVQGGRKPESAMDFELVSEAVKTIAHWIPATKSALADAGQLRTIIDAMLRWGLDDRLERQIIAGNGVGANLLGLLNQPGINAVGAGTGFAPGRHADKIHVGITAVRLDNLEPTGVAVHPTDWQTVRLSRENADGTGAYLFGSPALSGVDTLWGKPVVVTAAIPQGTAVVGAWRALMLWMREGAQIAASDSHEDYFTRNLVAILAELRAALGLPLPQAFAEVDLTAAA